MHGFRKAVAQEDGAILVFTVLILVVLLGMAALAIDIGQMYIAKQRAQNVCDAAALAGGPHLTGKPTCKVPTENAAIDCKDQNNDEVAPWQVEEFAVEFPTTVTFDDGRTQACLVGEAIKVTGRVHVDFAFAGVFGLSGLDVPADATVLLGPARTIYSTYLVPWGASPAVEDYTQGVRYDVGPVDRWQNSFIDAPGNWLTLSFGDDHGDSDYVKRLRMESEPVPLSVGDFVDTLTGGAGGEGTGQSKTYDGLIMKNKKLGRILLETDPRFQASATPSEYWMTGYNPNAWTAWDSTTNQYDLHPATNRIVILPIINPVGLTGSSEDVEIFGFAAFFIERVWDGDTVDPATGLIPERGDIQGRFIQAITTGSGSEGWIFEGTKVVGDSSVRDVYLIS